MDCLVDPRSTGRDGAVGGHSSASRNRYLVRCVLAIGAFDLFLAIRPMFRHGAYYAPGGHTDPYAYNWLVLILFVPYAFALRAYSRGAERPSVRAIVLGAAAISLPLVFVPPQQSHDVYQYLFYGKMQVAYGANPYVSAPHIFHPDPRSE